MLKEKNLKRFWLEVFQRNSDLEIGGYIFIYIHTHTHNVNSLIVPGIFHPPGHFVKVHDERQANNSECLLEKKHPRIKKETKM